MEEADVFRVGSPEGNKRLREDLSHHFHAPDTFNSTSKRLASSRNRSLERLVMGLKVRLFGVLYGCPPEHHLVPALTPLHPVFGAAPFGSSGEP